MTTYTTAQREWLDRSIMIAKVEIMADIAVGIVPAMIHSFSELHNYVDANCYGGLTAEDEAQTEREALFLTDPATESLYADDTFTDACNHLQDTISRWLEAGAHHLDIAMQVHSCTEEEIQILLSDDRREEADELLYLMVVNWDLNKQAYWMARTYRSFRYIDGAIGALSTKAAYVSVVDGLKKFGME